MITIDGSLFEGGGQMARTALALSTVLQKPFMMHSIRKGRPEPGLKSQHLEGIYALKRFCNAQAEGAELGSTELTYTPGNPQAGAYSIDIGTAGSITLLMQSLLLPALFSGKRCTFTITGGTDVAWAPPFDYFRSVFLPHISPYATFECKLIERGYYPKGQGKMEISIAPKFTKEELLAGKAPRFSLESRGELLQIKGISHASLELASANVAERQAEAVRRALSKLKIPLDIRNEYRKAASPGSGITLWARFGEQGEIDTKEILLGADALGERGKKAEEVGKEAANLLLSELSSDGCVDARLADQLIPFLALFGGAYRASSVTEHAKANLHVCEQFLGKRIEIEGTLFKSSGFH
ncbi:MAG: RNA 3'-terminal phosphate cyclase [Nanoarchaeota archaeon]|nr:RNA 3'-terminal phosphate cyclase [Nanoarchaeota archaeon]